MLRSMKMLQKTTMFTALRNLPIPFPKSLEISTKVAKHMAGLPRSPAIGFRQSNLMNSTKIFNYQATGVRQQRESVNCLRGLKAFNQQVKQKMEAVAGEAKTPSDLFNKLKMKAIRLSLMTMLFFPNWIKFIGRIFKPDADTPPKNRSDSLRLLKKDSVFNHHQIFSRLKMKAIAVSLAILAFFLRCLKPLWYLLKPHSQELIDIISDAAGELAEKRYPILGKLLVKPLIQLFKKILLWALFVYRPQMDTQAPQCVFKSVKGGMVVSIECAHKKEDMKVYLDSGYLYAKSNNGIVVIDRVKIDFYCPEDEITAEIGDGKLEIFIPGGDNRNIAKKDNFEIKWA